MPYRLDRCLIDWVSKIKQMKNSKGLRLIGTLDPVFGSPNRFLLADPKEQALLLWVLNRLEVLLMIAREVFCKSDRGYLCCFKQVLTSVLQLASKRLIAGNRYSNRESVKILKASFEDLESSWDYGAWESWSAVEIQIGDTYISPISPSRAKRVVWMTTFAQILSSPTKCFGTTSENSVDRVDRSLAK